jgi:ATP-dependent DNA helicase RecQ
LPLKTLEQYWGYTSFRGLQEDIISAVLEGKDALALLPTGGGKSICYQIPALLNEGVCFVVSPLIALMRDQVEQLKRRGISAVYLHSGLSRREIAVELENTRNNKYKLVYVSPERLKTEAFKHSFDQTRVSFVAIDEAHCISQWGHDFRPEYREIINLKEIKPDLQFLALTASATDEVRNDIIEQLGLTDYDVFQQSFHRSNLAYRVKYSDDKHGDVLRFVQKHPGSGIIYVRNRRKTVEWSRYLLNQSVSVDYYHAGLSSEDRNEKQDRWAKGKTKVMVATNAFGMGIDKADVRWVIHLGLPDSLESYYQEAGRAGRDDKESVCLLLYNDEDIVQARTQWSESYPTLKEVNRIYENLCNYFSLAFYTGQDARFDFDMADFCDKFENRAVTTYASLRILEKLGYLRLSSGVLRPSKLKVEVSSTSLYDFQLKTPALDPIIKVVLRSYSGIYDHFAVIREKDIAMRLKRSVASVVRDLETLHHQKVLTYQKRSDQPFITFVQPRVNEIMDKDALIASDKKRTQQRLEALIDYVEAELCRAILICEYFDEEGVAECQKCDVCDLNEKYKPSLDTFEQIASLITPVLAERSLKPAEIVDALPNYDAADVRNVIRWLLDDNKIQIKDNGEIEKRN